MTTDNHSSKPSGVDNPAVLDKIVHDPVKDTVSLVMIETRPWGIGERQHFEIQEKINSYLSFILDGEMTESFPHLAGKPVVIQLDCTQYPDDKTIDFLDRIQKELGKQGISFILRVIETVSR